MTSNRLRLKPVEQATGHGELKRSLGRSALLFFSVGSIDFGCEIAQSTTHRGLHDNTSGDGLHNTVAFHQLCCRFQHLLGLFVQDCDCANEH